MSDDSLVLYVGERGGESGLVAKLDSADHEWRLVTAETVADGVGTVEHRPVACVLSEQQLPDGTGTELLAELREREPFLPVLLLAKQWSRPVAQDAIAGNVTDYLVRAEESYSVTGVVERVEAAVDRYSEYSRQRENSQMFREMLDRLPLHLFVKDTEGRHVRVGKHFIETLDHDTSEMHVDEVTREAMLGATDLDLSPAAHAKRAYEDDMHVLVTEEKKITEELAGGSAASDWRRTAKVPWYDERGSLRGLLGYSMVIEQKKLYEQDLERHRKIVEAAGDPMYILDRNGRFVFVNTALVEASGYPESELLGSSAGLLIDESDLETGTDIVEMLRDSEKNQETFEMDLVTAGGERIRCENHIALLSPVDGTRQVAGVVRDITERKARTKQLEVFDRLLRHNLRNELNIVTVNAESITRQTDGSVAQLAAEIQDVSRRLVQLAETGRQIVNVLTDSHSTQPIAVGELVHPAVDSVRAEYPDADITVAGATDSVFLETLPELEQAIAELTQNAVIHSDRQTPSVTISVEVNTDTVELRVADDGPGIPAQERSVLTEDTRIDSLQHSSGAGLWLVKWIVTYSEGTLSFADNHPRGTVVTITIPRGEATTGA